MTNSYDVGSPPPRSRRERLGRPSRNRLDAHTIWRGSPGLVATHDSLRAFLVLRSTVTWTLWGVALMSRPVFQRTKLVRRLLSSTAGGGNATVLRPEHERERRRVGAMRRNCCSAVVASEATGEERECLFRTQVANVPQFGEYEKQAGRVIPVIFLTPKVTN